jgi:hypothetical protein
MQNERRFYVYTLADSRTDEVFYVGKGCGSRMHQHEKDCRAGRVFNGRKHQRIAEVVSAGATVVASKVQTGLTEGEALDAEKAMIRSIGIRNLTNISAGERSVETRLIELTKIRYRQCIETIAAALRGEPVDRSWAQAEVQWLRSCLATFRRHGVVDF